jgi:ABC-type phosphate transport system permease subunit
MVFTVDRVMVFPVYQEVFPFDAGGFYSLLLSFQILSFFSNSNIENRSNGIRPVRFSTVLQTTVTHVISVRGITN